MNRNISLQLILRLCSALSVVFLTPFSLWLNPAEAAGPSKIEPRLMDIFAARVSADFIIGFAEQADLAPAQGMSWQERGEFVLRSLQQVAERSQREAKEILNTEGKGFRTFIVGNELYVQGGNLSTADMLASLPEVASVRAPRTFQLPEQQPADVSTLAATLSWGITDSKADQFWSRYGKKGEGIIIADISTGVQWDHPALVNQFNCPGDPTNASCWYDPSNICGASGACDNNGLGTHNMGTMVGSDDPALLYSAGMAPAAKWISCKGCESASCSEFALNACADWMLAPGGNPANRPYIVHNPWGGGSGDVWYLGKVNAWRAAGIFPSFPAGQSGLCSSLSSPGDYQETFASAGHDSSRAIATWSSRGPSVFGHEPYTKPNISAPAVHICSSVPNAAWSCGYSGNNIAGAHSAGAVALLWSCNPLLAGQVDRTFEVLHAAADPPPAGNCGAPPDGEGNYTYGYGYLNVLAAGSDACQSRPFAMGPVMCFDLTRFDAEYFPPTKRIYVLGGSSSSAALAGNIYAVDPVSGSCADTGASMPVPIANYTANLVHDGSAWLLCTFGGRASDGNTPYVQCYNPITNSAFVKNSLPGALTGHIPGAQVVVNGKVYIIGGFNPSAPPYMTALTYRYDPVSNMFTRLSDLSLARSYIMAAAVDGQIYAFGGDTFDGASLIAVARAEKMADPEGAGTWDDAAVADLPLARGEGRAIGFDSTGAAELGGRIILTGGGQWPNNTAEVILYDVAANRYNEWFSHLNYARRNHGDAFAPVPEPRLWVFGGRYQSDNPPYAPAEFFRMAGPSRGFFQVIPNSRGGAAVIYLK